MLSHRTSSAVLASAVSSDYVSPPGAAKPGGAVGPSVRQVEGHLGQDQDDPADRDEGQWQGEVPLLDNQDLSQSLHDMHGIKLPFTF